MSRVISRISLVLILLLIGGCVAGRGSSAENAPRPERVLIHAHAHNDYQHARPLFDALEHGFISIEADIHLCDGALLVGHDAEDLRPDRTLRSLYLEPLRERVRASGGHVFRGRSDALVLLIDIKTAALPTYQALHAELAQFADIFTRVEDDVVHPGAVGAIVSGGRPIEFMRSQRLRYAAVDGRFSDLQSDVPVNFMPLISDSAPEHFAWRGTGPMPDSDRAKLRNVVAAAHSHGRQVRLWATLDQPEVWRELRAADVDLIVADDLDALSKFFDESR